MKVRIDTFGRGQTVSIRIDGAEVDVVVRCSSESGSTLSRRSEARIPFRRVPARSATPAMIARGIEAFLAQGDKARLGAALEEVWRAMEEGRSGSGDPEDDA